MNGQAWWHFDRYELADGYVRPVPGAALRRYDPWRQRHKQPAHIELVEAVAEIPGDQLIYAGPLGSRWQDKVPDALSRRIVAWCDDYGLLGLLLHDLVQARIGRVAIWRDGGEWRSDGYAYDPSADPPAEVVRADAADWAGTYGAEYWFHYFPDVSEERWERTRPLIPGTEAFWRAYQEPISDIVASAVVLRDIVGRLAISKRRGKRRKELSAALEEVNVLGRPVRAEVRLIPRSGPQRAWSSPSLLGHLAMQVVQGVISDQRWIVCASCGRHQQTAKATQVYCSNTCRVRENVRAHRRRSAAG